MNKRKLLGMLVALVLVAALGIGATLAYFTDTTDTLTNVVTMGDVKGIIAENDIKDEKVTDATTGTTKFEFDTEKAIKTNGGVEYDNVMPGDYIDKNPSVILKSTSQDAYVRVALTFEWGELSEADQAVIKEAVLKEISADDWKLGADSLYYYQTRMTAPDAADMTGDYIGTLTTKNADKNLIATLFKGFKVDDNLMNAAIGKEFNIKVTADLIQADNVKLNADGNAWVAADGTPITWTADGATKMQ